MSAARRSTSSWIRAMAVLDAAESHSRAEAPRAFGRGRAAVVASKLSWDYGIFQDSFKDKAKMRCEAGCEIAGLP